MIPTFKEAERAAINGTGTALGKFIIMFTPASKKMKRIFESSSKLYLQKLKS